jgi:Tfp pilus assembly PilM family ATPase
MAKTVLTSIGIEHDTISIRAAKLNIQTGGSRQKVVVAGLSELRGDFSTDESIAGGMKKIKEKIAVSPTDLVATTIAGKQVFVTQIPFRKLPDDEMKNALRLEIKKSISFEVAGAAIDFQMVEGTKKGDEAQYIVTAVPSVMVSRHLNMMERLGIKPYVVDVLPLSIANAFHLSQPSLAMGLAYVVAHIGPVVTNVVICGDAGVPFFHRSIYFLCDEIFGDNERAAELSGDELNRKLSDLTDEIARSIAFYGKTYGITSIAGVFLIGDYLDNPGIVTGISGKTGVSTEVIDVFSRLKQASSAPKGKFEVAVGLAMRNGEASAA